MAVDSVSIFRSRRSTLLTLCVAGSVATHVLILMLLPGWSAQRDARPRVLSVELSEPIPPEIVPSQPLPMETRPTPSTPRPLKPVVRSVQELRASQEPILTTPLEAPPSPTAVVVPEQRPAPAQEAPRPSPAPVAAPVTPPRSDAAYLNNPRPAYPLAARRRGDQGTVLIRVVVTADGLAANVNVEKTSGHPSLDEAALTAVKSWRFVPARQGGQAIESPYVVPVVFKLD